MSAHLPATKHAPGWAALLERFYLKAGLDLPALDQLKDAEVPQPYKTLLVHSSDMTPTLEGFYRQPLGITVLSREFRDSSYFREVLLRVPHERRPVAYGVIHISLDHLPEPARQRVLEEQHPLGHVLQTEAIPHMSWPQPFFRVNADGHMIKLLRLARARELYGRRNVLVDGSRRMIAEVIEVLAPVDHAPIDGDTRSIERD
jgi:chorismate-pyruvate lyase